MKYFVTIRERIHEIEVAERLGELHVSVNGEPAEVDYQDIDGLGQLGLIVDGRTYAVSIQGDANRADVSVAGHIYAFELEDERERAAHAADRERGAGGGDLKSVMPGVVVSLLAQEGDVVEKGQALLVLEAMKMQNEIGAPAAGTVKKIHVAEGAAVAGGTLLVTLGE